MKPETETLLLVIGTLLGFFLIPAILIALHVYLLAILFIALLIANIVVFVYYAYIEFLPLIRQKHLQDEELEHRFHGDPNKIKFFKGFMKFFDGSLDEKGLKQWFEKHPTKIKK